MAVLFTSGTLKTEVETEQVFGQNEKSQNLSIDFSRYNSVKSLIFQYELDTSYIFHTTSETLSFWLPVLR